jgi:hypothetical protein
MKTCVSCKIDKEKDGFSKKQWMNKSNNRRCSDCIAKNDSASLRVEGETLSNEGVRDSSNAIKAKGVDGAKASENIEPLITTVVLEQTTDLLSEEVATVATPNISAVAESPANVEKSPIVGAEPMHAGSVVELPSDALASLPTKDEVETVVEKQSVGVHAIEKLTTEPLTTKEHLATSNDKKMGDDEPKMDVQVEKAASVGPNVDPLQTQIVAGIIPPAASAQKHALVAKPDSKSVLEKPLATGENATKPVLVPTTLQKDQPKPIEVAPEPVNTAKPADPPGNLEVPTSKADEKKDEKAPSQAATNSTVPDLTKASSAEAAEVAACCIVM